MKKSSGYPNRLKPPPSARAADEGRFGRKRIIFLILSAVAAVMCVLLLRSSCREEPGSSRRRPSNLERESGESGHARLSRPRKNIKKKMKPADVEKPAGPEVIKGPVDLGTKIEMITEPAKEKKP